MSGETVTVACKLPNGLHLELQGRGRVTVRGNAYPVSVVPGSFKMPQIEATYALTPGVDAEFWEAWLEQNREMEFVKKGFIFAHDKQVNSIAHAREMEKEKTGLEPLDPDAPSPGLEKFSA